jgi:hypothetical protein
MKNGNPSFNGLPNLIARVGQCHEKPLHAKAANLCDYFAKARLKCLASVETRRETVVVEQTNRS